MNDVLISLRFLIIFLLLLGILILKSCGWRCKFINSKCISECACVCLCFDVLYIELMRNKCIVCTLTPRISVNWINIMQLLEEKQTGVKLSCSNYFHHTWHIIYPIYYYIFVLPIIKEYIDWFWNWLTTTTAIE